jgi:hypothetical protein
MQSMVAVSMVYFNAQSILVGLPDLGWEAVEKVYHARYDLDGCPWDAPLQWSGKGNLEPQWGRWYMSHPSSWYLPLALAGVRIDRLRNRLTLTPNWPSAWPDELKIPIFLPGFTAELNSQRRSRGWSVSLHLKRACDQPLIFDSIHTRFPVGIDPGSVRAETSDSRRLPVRVEGDRELRLTERVTLQREGEGITIFAV